MELTGDVEKSYFTGLVGTKIPSGKSVRMKSKKIETASLISFFFPPRNFADQGKQINGVVAGWSQGRSELFFEMEALQLVYLLIRKIHQGRNMMKRRGVTA